jgi:hypothetical protein
MNQSKVYRWCSEIEEVRKELSMSGQTERVSTIRPEDIDYLMTACQQCNVKCTKLGEVQEYRDHHGGGWYEIKERVRLNFQ